MTKTYYLDKKILKNKGEHYITDGVQTWGPIKADCVKKAINSLCWGERIPLEYYEIYDEKVADYCEDVETI